jgi:hypothetical protein
MIVIFNDHCQIYDLPIVKFIAHCQIYHLLSDSLIIVDNLFLTVKSPQPSQPASMPSLHFSVMLGRSSAVIGGTSILERFALISARSASSPESYFTVKVLIVSSTDLVTTRLE